MIYINIVTYVDTSYNIMLYHVYQLNFVTFLKHRHSTITHVQRQHQGISRLGSSPIHSIQSILVRLNNNLIILHNVLSFVSFSGIISESSKKIIDLFKNNAKVYLLVVDKSYMKGNSNMSEFWKMKAFQQRGYQEGLRDRSYHDSLSIDGLKKSNKALLKALKDLLTAIDDPQATQFVDNKTVKAVQNIRKVVKKYDEEKDSK